MRQIYAKTRDMTLAPPRSQHGITAPKRSGNWTPLKHKGRADPTRCSKPVIWSADQIALLNQSL